MPQIIGETSGRHVDPETPCPEKHRLLGVYTEVVHEIMLLHQQQVRDIVNDDDFSHFDLLLHSANERKELAKYGYLQHVDEHGC